MQFKLLAFDFDDTLFYTSNANFITYREAIARYCNGYTITRDWYDENIAGHDYREFLPKVAKDAKTIRLIHDEKIRLYADMCNRIEKNEDLFDLIRMERKKTDRPMLAIVTTASLTAVINILQKSGTADLFDFIIAKESVEHVKPSPEGYLKAMRIAEASPVQTLIFEDSETGFEAARGSHAFYLDVTTGIQSAIDVLDLRLKLKRMA